MRPKSNGMVIKEMPIGPFSVRLTKPMPDTRGSPRTHEKWEHKGALPGTHQGSWRCSARQASSEPEAALAVGLRARGVLSESLNLGVAIWQGRGDACPVPPCWATLVCRDGSVPLTSSTRGLFPRGLTQFKPNDGVNRWVRQKKNGGCE